MDQSFKDFSTFIVIPQRRLYPCFRGQRPLVIYKQRPKLPRKFLKGALETFDTIDGPFRPPFVASSRSVDMTISLLRELP